MGARHETVALALLSAASPLMGTLLANGVETSLDTAGTSACAPRWLMRRGRGGQSSVEFALLYGAVVLPLTFMLVFVSEMLWVWHSVVDFTRAGANYAATHCWMGDASNVTTYRSEEHTSELQS